MTARQQWSVVGAIVLVLAIGLTIAARSMKDDLYPLEPGSTAPNFSVRVLGDTTHKTFNANYKGKVVVLNIWATYCEPCKAEIPSLEKLHRLYGDSGLKIVAVENDKSVSDDSVAKFIKKYHATFEVLRETSGAIDNQYQTTGIPETFIIGPEGTIRRKWIGADDWTSQGNRALIAQLLGLKTPPPMIEIADTATKDSLRPAR
jgi:cytochrome c biogenesis protein CcmG/thiol:disulfide interchange protein DsbE